MSSGTHFIEQWKDKDGDYHFTKPKPLTEFNRSLTKSRYGFKTIAVWSIKPKPTAILATHEKDLNATILENIEQ